MRNSTKRISLAFAVAVIFFTSNVNAQRQRPSNSLRFNIGIDGAVTTGSIYYNTSSNYMLGITPSIQYFDARANTAFMLTSGYYNFYAKSYTLAGQTYTPGDTGVIPVKFGAKTFASPTIYFSGELGPAFETNTTNNNVKFDAAAGFGFESPQGLDIGLRYESFSGQGYYYGIFALRLAYSIKMK